MATNPYGISDSVWSVLTPEEKKSVSGGNQSTLSNMGTAYNPSGSSAGTSTGSSGNSALSQSGYADYLTESRNKIAEAAAEKERAALLSAYQGNKQALNSQKSTVANNYDSLVNQLTATRETQLPKYQTQRDQSSAEAAAQLKRTQALNALSGNYSSGSNRSQQLAIGLNRATALGNVNQSQNEFETGVTNQMSDADAQRVAALNDIADKLTLAKQQYNAGTLSTDTQLSSTEAANAAQALADAQQYYDTLAQQELTNAYNQGQLTFNEKQLAQEKALKEKQLAQEAEQYKTDLAYNYAALNKPSSSGGSGGTSLSNQKYYDQQETKAATEDAFVVLNNLANNGSTRTEILNYLNRHVADFGGADYDALLARAQNAFRWDKDEKGNWYNLDG